MNDGFDIPIDFCPKCKNKRIRIVMGKTYEVEYSLTGKCIKTYHKKGIYDDTTYILLKCTKCGWQSEPWSESGFNENEWEELNEIYIKAKENK